MAIAGKMEIQIKINEIPKEVKTVKDGWKEFAINVGEKEVSLIVRPKVFKKLEEAQQNYPQWVASISGKMGKETEKGFILEEANIQVFEKKAKVTEDIKKEGK